MSRMFHQILYSSPSESKTTYSRHFPFLSCSPFSVYTKTIAYLLFVFINFGQQIFNSFTQSIGLGSWGRDTKMLIVRGVGRSLKHGLRENPFLVFERGYGSRLEKKRMAIVLSGSGMLDGTEIHEASAAAVHLSKHNIEPVFYSVTCPQADVIDHSKSCPMSEIRSAFVESARIARGNICPINELRACDAMGVVFPGGFGVAKNMTSYAADGANCTIDAEVVRVLQEFHEAKKAMMFMCISAILPALVFPRVKVTLGMKGDLKKWPHCAAVDAAKEMGAEVEPRRVDEMSFDKQHFVFSTPAFMYNGTFYEIFSGIGNMIDTMNKVTR